MKIMPAALLTVALAAVSISAFGHHSSANYDPKLITISGTVTKYQYANPHAKIFFDGPDEDGVMQSWVVVTGSPGVLARIGWNRNTLTTGDTITVTGFLSKDGKRNIRVRPDRPTGHGLLVTSGASKGKTLKLGDD